MHACFLAAQIWGLATAEPRTFTLVPTQGMRDALTKDYEVMTGMVFGQVPLLSHVFESVAKLEHAINGKPI